MLPKATSGLIGFVPQGTVGYFVSMKCYFVAVLWYLSNLCIWIMGLMRALFLMCFSDVQSLDWLSCGRADVDLRMPSCLLVGNSDNLRS